MNPERSHLVRRDHGGALLGHFGMQRLAAHVRKRIGLGAVEEFIDIQEWR